MEHLAKLSKTSLLPKARGPKSWSYWTFLPQFTLDHHLFSKTLSTWVFLDGILFVVVVVVVVLLLFFFFFDRKVYFLGISSLLSSWVPLCPLPQENSPGSVLTLCFFLIYKQFPYLHFIHHLYSDDFKSLAQNFCPSLTCISNSCWLFHVVVCRHLRLQTCSFSAPSSQSRLMASPSI